MRFHWLHAIAGAGNTNFSREDESMDRKISPDNDRGGRLLRLEEVKDFDVAEGSRDIRGWHVKTPDGRDIGKVDELIVDPVAKLVRYMDVKVDRKALGIDDDRHILVPIGAAQLREDGKEVLIERLPARGLADAPAYSRGPITSEYEGLVRDYYGAAGNDDPANYYGHEMYDDNRMRNDSPGRRDAAGGHSPMTPRFGDNEVTLPMSDDQEVIVRRIGSDQEMVIRKSTAPDSGTGKDR